MDYMDYMPVDNMTDDDYPGPVEIYPPTFVFPKGMPGDELLITGVFDADAGVFDADAGVFDTDASGKDLILFISGTEIFSVRKSLMEGYSLDNLEPRSSLPLDSKGYYFCGCRVIYLPTTPQETKAILVGIRDGILDAQTWNGIYLSQADENIFSFTGKQVLCGNDIPREYLLRHSAPPNDRDTVIFVTRNRACAVNRDKAKMILSPAYFDIEDYYPCTRREPTQDKPWVSCDKSKAEIPMQVYLWPPHFGDPDELLEFIGKYHLETPPNVNEMAHMICLSESSRLLHPEIMDKWYREPGGLLDHAIDRIREYLSVANGKSETLRRLVGGDDLTGPERTYQLFDMVNAARYLGGYMPVVMLIDLSIHVSVAGDGEWLWSGTRYPGAGACHGITYVPARELLAKLVEHHHTFLGIATIPVIDAFEQPNPPNADQLQKWIRGIPSVLHTTWEQLQSGIEDDRNRIMPRSELELDKSSNPFGPSFQLVREGITESEKPRNERCFPWGQSGREEQTTSIVKKYDESSGSTGLERLKGKPVREGEKLKLRLYQAQ
ncbi:hypothetical protein FA95DRAFT_1576619 [Auriscalpium vulgare]|uniref:Uncharacterized protein n=1 Tax=Auriscalpium vulgare TaxID=40419 RepID=A0ACB8RAE7_9AGAM|nr:hypothetical protein FA95DRAFT_1576619 [Auriscalpium vulgare]